MSFLKHKNIFSAAALAGAALLFPSAATADSSPAYNFLNVTSSAKIYGLGGMNISLVDNDFMTTDQNPALLGPEFNNNIGLDYMHYVGGSNFAGLRYAHAAGERGAWAVGLRYFGYGSIKEADEMGNVYGTFSPSDISFNASYSHDITERIRGGITLKFAYSSYAEYSALALATDLGINYYDPDHDLSLSLVAANLGGQIKRFNESYDRLPMDVRLGWSQSFGTFPVRFSVTAWNLTRWHLPYTDPGDGTEMNPPELKDSFSSNLFRHLIFGADIIASPNYFISLGYNYKMRTDMSTYSRSFLSGWTLGGGFRVRGFGISLAFAQPHKSATTLMFNLSCNLSELIN